jgi:hypothetical protein
MRSIFLVFLSSMLVFAGLAQKRTSNSDVPLCGMIPYFGATLPPGFVWADGKSVWPQIPCAVGAGIAGRPIPSMVGNLLGGAEDSNPTAIPSNLLTPVAHPLGGLLLARTDDVYCGFQPAAPGYEKQNVFTLPGVPITQCRGQVIPSQAPGVAGSAAFYASFIGVPAVEQPHIRANWIVRVQ